MKQWEEGSGVGRKDVVVGGWVEMGLREGSWGGVEWSGVVVCGEDKRLEGIWDRIMFHDRSAAIAAVREQLSSWFLLFFVFVFFDFGKNNSSLIFRWCDGSVQWFIIFIFLYVTKMCPNVKIGL